MSRFVLAVFFVFVVFFLSSCEDTNVFVLTDAATDAVTAVTLSDENVKELAANAALASDNAQRVAPRGNPYERRLASLVGPHSQRDGNSFNFKVYLTPEVNAFAMADGTVRVYSGLMDLMTDEEVLFVIGHEMGHVVKEHSRKQVVLAYASSALRKTLASQENEVGEIARSMIGAFVQQLTSAQFSQHEERQADQYGVQFLLDAGSNPKAAVTALEKLAELARTKHTILSSHPDPASRAKEISLDGDSEGDEQWAIWETLLHYAKAVIVGLLQLLRALLVWLFSFF